MSVRKRGGIYSLGTGALALLALGAVVSQPAWAQTRTQASLADVPALVPAPYHAQAITAVYSTSLYDGYSNYGGVSQGSRAHYWH